MKRLSAADVGRAMDQLIREGCSEGYARSIIETALRSGVDPVALYYTMRREKQLRFAERYSIGPAKMGRAIHNTVQCTNKESNGMKIQIFADPTGSGFTAHENPGDMRRETEHTHYHYFTTATDLIAFVRMRVRQFEADKKRLSTLEAKLKKINEDQEAHRREGANLENERHEAAKEAEALRMRLNKGR
jgi:hypothetical protein